MLALIPMGWAGYSALPREMKTVTQYRVSGLTTENETFISNFGGPLRPIWRIWRTKDGEVWDGNYKTAEDALTALQAKVDKNS